MAIVPKRDPIIESLTSKQKWYVTLRRCHVNGSERIRGEVFDTTGLSMDRIESLVSRRYLFMMPYGLKPPGARVGPDGVERMMLPGFDSVVVAEPEAGEQSDDEYQDAEVVEEGEAA